MWNEHNSQKYTTMKIPHSLRDFHGSKRHVSSVLIKVKGLCSRGNGTLHPSV